MTPSASLERVLRPVIVSALATLAVTANHSYAGTYVADPDRLWPSGVVNYRFLNNLKNVGVCQGSNPTVFCNTTNPPATCSQFVACIPLTNGRCIGGDSAAMNWPTCSTSNGNGDCNAAGVTNGQCVVTLLSAACISMELWEAEANLTFREWSCPQVNNQSVPTCPGRPCLRSAPDNGIQFRATQGVSSVSDSIGRNPDAIQNIRIRLRTGNVGGFGIAHELGHALALFHEQQRPDRANYIDVDTTLVQSGLEGNFSVADDSDAYPRLGHGTAVQFDFESIMMYALCRFSNCGDTCGNGAGLCVNNTATCRPIQRLVPFAGDDTCCSTASGDPCIGQRNHFSDFDKLTMKFLYPQPGWRFVDRWYPGETETGTFVQPQKAFPDGVDVTPNDGTLWVQPGNYAAVGLYVRPMTILAPIGPVTLQD